MQRIFLICSVLMMLIFHGCQDTNPPLFVVDVEVNEDMVLTPALSLLATHGFTLRNVPTRIQSNLQLNGLSEDQVEGIFGGDAFINNVFENVDWTFIQRVEVFAKDPANPSTRRQMFFIREPDFSQRDQIQMFNTAQNLADFFLNDFVDIDVEFTLRQPVPTNIRAQIRFTYAVYSK